MYAWFKAVTSEHPCVYVLYLRMYVSKFAWRFIFHHVYLYRVQVVESCEWLERVYGLYWVKSVTWGSAHLLTTAFPVETVNGLYTYSRYMRICMWGRF